MSSKKTKSKNIHIYKNLNGYKKTCKRFPIKEHEEKKIVEKKIEEAEIDEFGYAMQMKTLAVPEKE